MAAPGPRNWPDPQWLDATAAYAKKECSLMATLTPPTTVDWNAADLYEHFGPIPLRRIRYDPEPGTATEQDVVEIHQREKRLYELVDGVLVEKTVGIAESYLAALIVRLLGNYVDHRKLGIVFGADGMARLSSGLIRIPDVSFVSWDRLKGLKVPTGPFLTLAPELAVEVLSPSNTKKEMSRKLLEYFEAGVMFVWYVDPIARTVEVFTSPDQSVVLREGEILDGGAPLPGFQLPLSELFSELERPKAP